MAALHRWAAAGLLSSLMDGTPVGRPRPGESEEEMGRRWWSDGLRGQRLDRPRLIMQEGDLLLQVPSPREATVPHRELPGLSFG
ncbi:MAG TPA: hypothetical protein VFP01_02505 [Propionibacteriaceae bacterium]|nr:hypothetical protein [Propionibacteriaceae bacterium]